MTICTVGWNKNMKCRRGYLVVDARVGVFGGALALVPRLDEVLGLLWHGEIQSVDASTNNGQRARDGDDETHRAVSTTLYRLSAPSIRETRAWKTRFYFNTGPFSVRCACFPQVCPTSEHRP